MRPVSVYPPMMLPQPVSDSLRGRRVLVLGGTGFIGRWVARALVDAGAQVTATVRDASASQALVERLAIRAEPVPCDLFVPGELRRLVVALRPEIVVNLAGYGIAHDQKDESLGRRVNFAAVAELADAVASKETLIVHAGSAFEYGRAGGALDEHGVAEPTGWYGRSKLAATRLLAENARARGLRAVVARLFTVYGPGEHAGRLLPTLIAAAQSGQRAELSSGEQMRDFTYVGDVVEGLLRLAVAPNAAGQIVNLATGRLMSVRHFAETAAAILGMPPEQLAFGARRASSADMVHEPVTIARLRHLVDWTPTIEVPAGIARSIAAANTGQL